MDDVVGKEERLDLGNLKALASSSTKHRIAALSAVRQHLQASSKDMGSTRARIVAHRS